jgi:hypothetical protein
MNLSPSEVTVIKNALVDYKANLVGAGTQYSIATALLHTLVEKEAKEANKANKTPKVIPNKQFMFNFTTGGWNTVWAKTKRGAIAQATREYKTSNLIPNPKTFAVATDAAMKNALSLFY